MDLARFLPTAAAALLCGAVLLVVAFVQPRAPARGNAPSSPAVERPASPPPSVTAPAPAVQQPPATTYVVREGDSLWKIFHQMEKGGRGWTDFLSTTSSANGILDPDTIRPGKILTLPPSAR